MATNNYFGFDGYVFQFGSGGKSVRTDRRGLAPRNFHVSTILAASGGGKKTTIYSVDDGVAGDDNPPVTTNKAFATYDTDLLDKDGTVAAWG